MRILITGGAGFIGSNLTLNLLEKGYELLIIDKLSYAANIELVNELKKFKNYNFIKADICETSKLKKVFVSFKPQSVFHLAAESHVDRSIQEPEAFIQSNIFGTYQLLSRCNEFYDALNAKEKQKFRFIHVSTDEVYGDIEKYQTLPTEDSPLKPSSPYSASKASSDLLLKAWMRTYKFPSIIARCTNNLGPFQNIEKLIPNAISKIMNHQKISIYGDGKQIRDWLFVEDHVLALEQILLKGKVFETYNIGSNNQIENIELLRKIMRILIKKLNLDEKLTEKHFEFVEDRPGHDFRYGLDCKKITEELQWLPSSEFNKSLEITIDWYINMLSDKKL